jgi:hypothetical protein
MMWDDPSAGFLRSPWYQSPTLDDQVLCCTLVSTESRGIWLTMLSPYRILTRARMSKPSQLDDGEMSPLYPFQGLPMGRVRSHQSLR